MSIQSLQRQSGHILEQTTYQGKEKRSVQNTKMPEVVEQCCFVQTCFCRYHIITWSSILQQVVHGVKCHYIAQVVENTFPKSEEMFSGLMIRLE